MKVFSAKKWLQTALNSDFDIDEIILHLTTWVVKCDGYSKEDMEKMGFITLNQWMRDEEK